MIVTLGRQCGCAGDEIGRKLSELLGIPFYTKPELIALAKEKKIYEKYPMYFGEQPVNAMISVRRISMIHRNGHCQQCLVDRVLLL